MTDFNVDDQLVCPDPYEDPEGFFLYQEMISCVACDGVGEGVDDGEAWVCPRCNGSGVDPSYEGAPNSDRGQI